MRYAKCWRFLPYWAGIEHWSMVLSYASLMYLLDWSSLWDWLECEEICSCFGYLKSIFIKYKLTSRRTELGLLLLNWICKLQDILKSWGHLSGRCKRWLGRLVGLSDTEMWGGLLAVVEDCVTTGSDLVQAFKSKLGWWTASIGTDLLLHLSRGPRSHSFVTTLVLLACIFKLSDRKCKLRGGFHFLTRARQIR